MKLFKTLLSLFSAKEKWQIFGLFILILFGAVFEALGLSLILSFISILQSPEKIKDIPFFVVFIKSGGVYENNNFLVIASLTVVGIYLLKNIYLTYLSYIQNMFLNNKQYIFSNRLFRAYISGSYLFHLQNNSSTLIRNITGEVGNLFGSVLTPCILFLTEVIVLLSISILLLIVDPISSSISAFCIGFLTIFFYRKVHLKLSLLGLQRQQYAGKMIQAINQGLGGVKESKVLGRESFFVEQYNRSSLGFTRTSQFSQVINQLPRFFIESIAVTSLMLIVISVLLQGRNLTTIIPTLSLFAAAAFRLMPSVNRILSAMTMIRFNSHSVYLLANELKELGALSNEKTPSNNQKGNPSATGLKSSIVLQNVSYQYPGAPECSLNNVSLTISKGSSVGFVGASGAGKTTIVDVILGLLPPTEGQVLVDDQNIHEDLSAWQRSLGYIPQSIYLCDDTLRGNIAFGIPNTEIREEQILAAVASAQLTELVQSLPQGLDTVVGERGVRLSGGQRQRVGIARALYHNPEVLVMDEATAALDNQTEAGVMEAIEKLSREKTIIMIAHRLSTVKNCDRLYFMKNGQIYDSGTYDELCARNREFQRMAQVNLDSATNNIH